jgi:Ser/Thr protein kinase RdoA (MazF antagonist)
LEFELAYLDYLKHANFPYETPSGVPTRGGRLFVNVQGDYYWLYEFLEGIVIERLNEARLAQLARMMASYHQTIEGSNLNNGRPASDLFNRTELLRAIDDYETEIGRNRSNRVDDIFLQESARLTPILSGLDGSPHANLRRYPIHGDINPGNLVWKDDRLTGLLDWENVSTTNGPTVRDIATMLNHTCRDPRVKSQLDLERSRRFVHSYKQYHPMSDREFRLIPDLMTAGSIEDFLWAFWMLKNDPERARADRLTRYSKAAQLSHSNRDMITEALMN